MKFKLQIVSLLIVFYSGMANANMWISAIPTSVRLVDNGLLLLGPFDNTGITCATGPQGIFVPGTDPKLKEKLSLALVAFTAGKKIEAYIPSPISSSCIAVSAIGSVPVVHTNYWYLK